MANYVLTIMVDIGVELRTSLVEEYANERKPTDGEIYRKIRQYEGDYDETFRERWFELGELEQPRNGKPSPQEDRQDLSPLRLKYRSEEPAYRYVVDAVVASDAITYEALVEPLRLGTLGSAIDPHPTPPVAEDTSVPDSSVAGLMPLRAVEQRPPQQYIEIELWSLERGEWRRSDRLRVDPLDPSPLERVAQKYLWKNYSLYDKNLHNLRPAQCYRAATADGSNAFFIVSEYEEKKLAAEGRVVKEKKLLGMASRVLDRVEGGRYPRFS
ncbi:hypothetical protein N7537_012284 [Penicillium hordei]|uniref:Uncharacterized protein n=1 Tax=Penicillium hordei TaxID=40994 RepID=A0AAD6GSJ6_9EURO|nr:uncharacterized protein N7537_012284 [Penicillium hordei]KAJ5589606.1 hypothetical protein N7537_012284 [Penicillium hordei]